jgi:hypothetical protein
MLGVFGFINLLDSPTTTPTTVPVIIGGLPCCTTKIFVSFNLGGEPPSDIASGLIAPVDTSILGQVVTGGGGAGNYDQAIRLGVTASRANLLAFYRSHLVALGWNLFSTTGAPQGSAQLLFQKAGSDGWYWEAGVTARATGPGTTSYVYRLFQASDFS